jgi:hypothetical protein
VKGTANVSFKFASLFYENSKKSKNNKKNHKNYQNQGLIAIYFFISKDSIVRVAMQWLL